MKAEVLEEVKKEVQKKDGSLVWSLYRRRMADGESAWISETSTEQRQRTNIRCLWRVSRSVLRIPGALAGNRDRLEESGSGKNNEAAYYEEGITEAYRQNQFCQTIYFQSVWAYRAIHGSRENQVR